MGIVHIAAAMFAVVAVVVALVAAATTNWALVSLSTLAAVGIWVASRVWAPRRPANDNEQHREGKYSTEDNERDEDTSTDSDDYDNSVDSVDATGSANAP